MEKMICILLSIVVVAFHSVSGQCGCKPQNLLKRSGETMKMGDMILDKGAIAVINGFKNHYANTARWPNNQVLFMFNRNFPADKKAVVRQSLGELQNDLRGCVQFIESGQNHYVDVQSQNDGCFSALGYVGGPSQQLNLENPGCMYSKGTIKHEFIHALGFMHTHMRKDRDNHIDIKWSRILTDMCSQFTKCNGCELDGPYETTSVMHYNSEGFACDPREKVVTKKGGGSIGYNHDTTPNDLQMIRNFYRC